MLVSEKPMVGGVCSLKGEVLGWSTFFVGIVATAFGSAYYHLKPNDARLVWDRLPVSQMPYVPHESNCFLHSQTSCKWRPILSHSNRASLGK